MPNDATAAEQREGLSRDEQVLVRGHRFELLDGIRGVGALFVATLHTPPTMQRLLPFPNSFLAVDLFFCLSGFVIAFAYEERLQRGLSWTRFMLARIIRLYPLYLLGLCLGALAIAGRSHFLPAGERHGLAALVSFGLNSTMLPAVLPTTIMTNAFPFNPPAWSLFFEMLINGVYAALLLGRKASSMVLGLLAILSLGTTLVAVFGHGADFASGWAANRTLLLGIPRVGYSFFVGVLLFRLFRATPSLRIPPHLQVVAGILVIVAVGTLLGGSFRGMQTLKFQAVAIVVLMPLVIVVGACVPLTGIWRRVCLVLGEISYPLYVLHLPLLSPLYLLQRLHVTGWWLQVAAPLSVLLLAVAARWIGLHYDAPVRRYWNRRLATASV